MTSDLKMSPCQAQMPSCVELPEDTSAAAAAQQCPYFSFTSLEDVVQTARESGFVGGGSNSNGNHRAPASAASAASNVVSVGVDLSSLSRYESYMTKLEQLLNEAEIVIASEQTSDIPYITATSP